MLKKYLLIFVCARDQIRTSGEVALVDANLQDSVNTNANLMRVKEHLFFDVPFGRK